MKSVLLFVALSISRGVATTNQGCNEPLGLEDGRIKDNQLWSSSVYKDDFDTYGAHQARLNKHTWPPGYRSKHGSFVMPWIRVDLGKPTVISGIAMQGYGDESVKEWVKRYALLYGDGNIYKVIKSNSGMVFKGNTDSHRVQLSYLKYPVLTSSVVVLPFQRQVGLRMELYGCQPDYFIVVWLMTSRTFRMSYIYPDSGEYKMVQDEMTSELQSFLQTTAGYLTLRVRHLRPFPNQYYLPKTTAEVEIYCLQSEGEMILLKLENYIKKSSFFDSSFFEVNTPAVKDICQPPILDIGLPKLPSQTKPIKGRIIVLKVKKTDRCNDPSALTIINCVGTGIDSDMGLFKFFNPLGHPNAPLRRFMQLSFGYNQNNVKLAYIMCSSQTIANRTLVGLSYDYGYLQVRVSRLVARINGPDYAITGIKSVSFNALDSVDYMERWRGNKGIGFKWECLHKGKTMNDVFVHNSTRTLLHCKQEYCLYNATVTATKVHLRVTKLKEKETYDIRLIAKKGNRTVDAVKRFSVLARPFVLIKCLQNCGNRINRTKPIVFETICRGDACTKIKSQSFKAALNNVTIAEKKAKTMIPLINIGNTWIQGNDVVDVETTYDWGDGILMTTKSSLMYKHCFVSPLIGEVLVTNFIVHCKGWNHTARYQVILRSRDRKTKGIVLATSKVPDINVVLPVGDDDMDYRLQLLVRIRESTVEDARELQLKVTRIRPSEVLNHLDDHGNITDWLGTALAAVSALENGESVEKDIVKGLILREMRNVTFESVHNVQKALYIVHKCLGQNMSQEAQEVALRILHYGWYFLKSQKPNPTTLLHSVGESVAMAVGDILQSASSVTANLTRSAKREIAEESMHLVESVSKTFLDTKDEKTDHIIHTGFMAILVSKRPLTSFSGYTVNLNGAAIKLPPYSAFYEGVVNDDVYVHLQVCVIKKNTFTWDKSAQNVRSAVIDINMSVNMQKIPLQNRSLDANQTNRSNGTSPGGILRQRQKQRQVEVTQFRTPMELYLPRTRQKGTDETQGDKEYFLKPSDGNDSFIRYHVIDITSPHATVTIHLSPMQEVLLEAYVRYNERPTPENYTFMTTLPHRRCSQQDIILNTCNPYAFSISKNITGYTGLHYLGLRYIQREEVSRSSENVLKDITDPLIMTRSKRSLKGTKSPVTQQHRQRRACPTYKDPPTAPPSPGHDVIPVYNAKTDVNYTFDVTSGTCMYWDTEHQRWKTEGCWLGPNSNDTHIHCICNHLTPFGGDFFVAPNPIDYNKVWDAFLTLNESGNVAVLAAVCTILALYLIGLVFARRADNKDKKKVVNKTMRLVAEDDPNTYSYKILIHTGSWRGNGTTARVGLIIFGENTCTPAICLENTDDTDTIFFARGSANVFNVELKEDLGTLVKVKLWHDNSGPSPDWFVTQVVITDIESKQVKHFLFNRWLACGKEGGKLGAEVQAYEKDLKDRFRHLFYLRKDKGLSEGHLWMSVFARPPQSPFTRCQRLSCCMSILFAAMITSAMFYNISGPRLSQTLIIGPIKINLADVKIGIQSALIATPINAIIVLMFSKSGRPIKPGDDGRKHRSPCLAYFVHISAWVLCISVILVSATYVVFYSMQWGREISDGWLVAVAVFVTQDIFIKDPIKVIVLACFLAWLFKKPPPSDAGSTENIRAKEMGVKNNVDMPSDDMLVEDRQFVEHKQELFRVLREIVRVTIMIVLFMVVCYGNRGKSRYMLTKSMEDIFQTFQKVDEHHEFWSWTRHDLLPGLYNTTWYNGKPFIYQEGFLSNREVFILGMPRLRQVRIKPDEYCSLKSHNPELAQMFPRCISTFSSENEELSSYFQPYWIPLWVPRHNTSNATIDAICPKPWRYQGDSAVHSLSLYTPSYSNGGYIAELGYNMNTALNVTNDLETRAWIDDLTAAVFVEFNVFEPSSSLFSMVKYSYELSPTGARYIRKSLQTVAVYSSPDPKTRKVHTFFKIMFMVFVIVCAVLEIRKSCTVGCKYLKNPSNWLEIILLALCVLSFVMNSYVAYFAEQYVKDIQENPYKNWSTEEFLFWSNLEIYILGVIIFILTVSLLKLIRFNKHIALMMYILKSASPLLISYSVVYITAVLAFSMFSNVAFGSRVRSYSSMVSSARKVMENGAFGGDIKFGEIRDFNPILGPIYMVLLQVIVLFILINMFIAILNFSYSVASAEQQAGKKLKDVETAKFAKYYFLEFLPKWTCTFWHHWAQNMKLKCALHKGKYKVSSKLQKRRKGGNKYAWETSISSDSSTSLSLAKSDAHSSSCHHEQHACCKIFEHLYCTCCQNNNTSNSSIDYNKVPIHTETNSANGPVTPFVMQSFQGMRQSEKVFKGDQSKDEDKYEDDAKEKLDVISTVSDFDNFDDIMYLDDDMNMVEIKRHFSEISLSLKSPLTSLQNTEGKQQKRKVSRNSDSGESIGRDSHVAARNAAKYGSGWSFTSAYYNIQDNEAGINAQPDDGVDSDNSTLSLEVYSEENGHKENP